MRQPPRDLPIDDSRHGSYAGYMAGCRCAPCIEAERAYQRMRTRAVAYGRPLTVPSLGSVRRVQALMAAGWAGTYLSDRLGCPRANLPVDALRKQWVRTWRARQIADLYDELHLQAGPSEFTRRRAEQNGWAVPESWHGLDIDDPDATPQDPSAPPVMGAHDDIDPIAVERACSGRPPARLTVGERRAVVRQLHRQRLSDQAIAARSGITARTVLRIRQELGLPAVEAAA